MRSNAQVLWLSLRGMIKRMSTSADPSAIVKCRAARTLKTHVRLSAPSVIERTQANLSAREKTLVFIIYSLLFSCNPTLGGAEGRKSTTFVVPKPFQTFFDCKFTFLNEFNWYFYVFCCHERLNLQLRLKMKPRRWFTLTFSSFMLHSMFNKLVVQSPFHCFIYFMWLSTLLISSIV